MDTLRSFLHWKIADHFTLHSKATSSYTQLSSSSMYNKLISASQCNPCNARKDFYKEKYTFFFLHYCTSQNHLAGRIKPVRGPDPAHGPYDWHPCLRRLRFLSCTPRGSRIKSRCRIVVWVTTKPAWMHFRCINLYPWSIPYWFNCSCRKRATCSRSDWAFLLNSPNDFRCLRNVDILILMPSSLLRNIHISQCLNPSRK